MSYDDNENAPQEEEVDQVLTLGEAQEGKSYDAFTPIPDGTLANATLTICRKRKLPWKDRDTGADVWEVNFGFEISDGDFAGRKVYGSAKPVFDEHPDCRLYNWVLQLLGVASLPVGFQLDLTALEGTECRIGIAAREKNKKGSTTEKYIRNFVTDIMPTSETAGENRGVDSTWDGGDEEPF